jgi:hypothetical protein
MLQVSRKCRVVGYYSFENLPGKTSQRGAARPADQPLTRTHTHSRARTHTFSLFLSFGTRKINKSTRRRWWLKFRVICRTVAREMASVKKKKKNGLAVGS